MPHNIHMLGVEHGNGKPDTFLIMDGDKELAEFDSREKAEQYGWDLVALKESRELEQEKRRCRITMSSLSA